MGEATVARRRLVFDELFRLQLALILRKRAIERTEVGLSHIVDGPLLAKLLLATALPADGGPAARHR